jgi:hypothetical protein
MVGNRIEQRLVQLEPERRCRGDKLQVLVTCKDVAVRRRQGIRNALDGGS